MKKVGIMGGTFDPIHLGHMLIAENAYETYNLNEVLFVPTGLSHFKTSVLDAKTRAKMTGIAIEDNPHFAMSTIETDKDTYSYSYETIASLKKNNPDNEYYFIVGADSLLYMDQWKCPEKIFGEVPVLVASRNGSTSEEVKAKITELKEKFGADIRILPIKRLDISSTDIRNKVKEGKSIRYLVHYKVVEYINRHNLYKEEQ